MKNNLYAAGSCVYIGLIVCGSCYEYRSLLLLLRLRCPSFVLPKMPIGKEEKGYTCVKLKVLDKQKGHKSIVQRWTCEFLKKRENPPRMK